MPSINQKVIDDSLSFDEYLTLTEDILSEKVERSGIYTNDDTFRYTRSNLDRMKKVLDRMVLNKKLYNLLSDLTNRWIWLVISEPWCGDASWGTPELYLLSQISENINFRIILRDKYPDIMKNYQTEGTDSIPKLICLKDDSLEEIGTWGPRPEALQTLTKLSVNNTDLSYRDKVRALHAWYEEDMGKEIQNEMVMLVKEWKEK